MPVVPCPITTTGSGDSCGVVGRYTRAELMPSAPLPRYVRYAARKMFTPLVAVKPEAPAPTTADWASDMARVESGAHRTTSPRVPFDMAGKEPGGMYTSLGESPHAIEGSSTRTGPASTLASELPPPSEPVSIDDPPASDDDELVSVSDGTRDGAGGLVTDCREPRM